MPPISSRRLRRRSLNLHLPPPPTPRVRGLPSSRWQSIETVVSQLLLLSCNFSAEGRCSSLQVREMILLGLNTRLFPMAILVPSVFSICPWLLFLLRCDMCSHRCTPLHANSTKATYFFIPCSSLESFFEGPSLLLPPHKHGAAAGYPALTKNINFRPVNLLPHSPSLLCLLCLCGTLPPSFGQGRGWCRTNTK